MAIWKIFGIWLVLWLLPFGWEAVPYLMDVVEYGLPGAGLHRVAAWGSHMLIGGIAMWDRHRVHDPGTRGLVWFYHVLAMITTAVILYVYVRVADFTSSLGVAQGKVWSAPAEIVTAAGASVWIWTVILIFVPPVFHRIGHHMGKMK